MIHISHEDTTAIHVEGARITTKGTFICTARDLDVLLTELLAARLALTDDLRLAELHNSLSAGLRAIAPPVAAMALHPSNPARAPMPSSMIGLGRAVIRSRWS